MQRDINKHERKQITKVVFETKREISQFKRNLDPLLKQGKVGNTEGKYCLVSNFG